MVSKSLRHFGEGSVTEEFHDGVQTDLELLA